MSLELGPVDFVSCIHLAHKVLRGCQDTPAEFHAVAAAVTCLEQILGEVQESVSRHELSERRQIDLRQLVFGCKEVLMELQCLLYQYKGLGTQIKITWLSWGREKVESISQRINARIGRLTAFNVAIVSASQAKVQRLLQQLLFEHQAGLHEASIISSDNLRSAEDGNEDIWSRISQELEEVGITSPMIRDHRHYITRWIKHALKLGKINEGSVEVFCPDPFSAEGHSLVNMAYEQEKFIAISDESVGIRTINMKGQDILQELFAPRGSTVSQLPVYSFIEPEIQPRPGDVALSNGQSRQYVCAHIYCKESSNFKYTTWFDILLHARAHHSAGRLPWAAKRRIDPHKEEADQPNLLCVNDSGKYLASRGPYTNIPADHDRDELAYLLTQLYEAVGDGAIPPEIPQLMYDLYYSRRCAFSDCRVTSNNDSEHRQHFISHFQIHDSQYHTDIPPSMHSNLATLQSACNLQALARVQRTYVFQIDERTARNRASRNVNFFRQSQHPSARQSCIQHMPYYTNYSGETIEAIIGAPEALSITVSPTLPAEKPLPAPPTSQDFQLDYKLDRYSRPRAFALVPDLLTDPLPQKHVIHEHTYSVSSSGSSSSGAGYIPLSKRVNGARYGGNSTLSGKKQNSGALFILESCRNMIGVSH